ncbi:carboxypeptidase regulatory-like domain-containing protein, partial [Candidatus Parcubacteria bacterium]|nr:carboxypeptidase regulatory-like domain-containing protein [Candidatus Parcubacteria bacterium]
VKPSSSVKSIKAQFTLREKSQSINSNPKHSFSDLFVSSVLAQNADTRFVLAEFELTDPDEDGIYTAEFQSPLVAGEYELIALLDFEDEDIQNKELRVITLVDPEGYIYTNLPQGEARIKDAEVFLYWLNTEKQAYQLWQADEYQQINPQITRQTGEYSFLVPEGTYYLKVEADRYLDFQTEPFEVKEGEGIHQNIELEKGFWQGLDWRIIAIVSLAIISTITLMLLLYNFYHDRKFRKKLEN